MGARAEELAGKYDQACREFSTVIEKLSDAQWKTSTGSEQWTVGVVAHHVAGGHAGISGLINLIAKGQPLPGLTMEMIHQGNAQHAKEHANVAKAETLALHRDNAAKATTIVRGLSDVELDRSAKVLGERQMTAAQAIEGILINHVREHLRSIQTAVGAK